MKHPQNVAIPDNVNTISKIDFSNEAYDPSGIDPYFFASIPFSQNDIISLDKVHSSRSRNSIDEAPKNAISHSCSIISPSDNDPFVLSSPNIAVSSLRSPKRNRKGIKRPNRFCFKRN